MKDEIIIYNSTQDSTRIEVLIKADTVWLNRQQLADLFNRDVKTIGKHIQNALKEELREIPTVANFATVGTEGNRKVTRTLEFYNLDMILSIGYRVKSEQGVHFRIWANKILKDYLIKGYVVNKRIHQLESEVSSIKEKISEFDIQLKTNIKPKEGIFFDGQVFDAYVFVSGIIKSANNSIILIDNYIDETILSLVDKRKNNTRATIYTSKLNQKTKLDIDKHNQQYPTIEVKTFTKSHDRFIIIDNNKVYHIGASLKDLGKKWFAFSLLNIDANLIISNLG